MQRSRNLAVYETAVANKPKEDEEEENAAENRKQPERYPIRGSQGWAKDRAAGARSQRAGKLAGYATWMANDLKEEDDEENEASNFKKPVRNPVRGSHGWGNENAPT